MLPQKPALLNLGRSQRTIRDYSKVTPLTVDVPSSLLTQFPPPKKGQ